MVQNVYMQKVSDERDALGFKPLKGEYNLHSSVESPHRTLKEWEAEFRNGTRSKESRAKYELVLPNVIRWDMGRGWGIHSYMDIIFD